jgi:hypothetical protein
MAENLDSKADIKELQSAIMKECLERREKEKNVEDAEGSLRKVQDEDKEKLIGHFDVFERLWTTVSEDSYL